MRLTLIIVFFSGVLRKWGEILKTTLLKKFLKCREAEVWFDSQGGCGGKKRLFYFKMEDT